MGAVGREWRAATPIALLCALFASACKPDDDLPDPIIDTDTEPVVGVHPHEDIAEGIQGLPGEPMGLATPEQIEAFYRGRELFKRKWTKAEGVGPDFSTISCLACHERPALGGAAPLYRNSAYGGFDDGNGGTMVYEGEAGGALNGGVVRTYRNEGPDGRGRFPVNDLQAFSSLNAVPLFGIGLFVTLTDEELLERSDPDDADGDGISGRPFNARLGIGRISLKAGAVGVREVITTSLSHYSQLTFNPLAPADLARLPFGDSGDGRTESFDNDAISDGEVTSAELADLITFVHLLAAPQFDLMTDEALEGRDLFDAIGCAACHTPRLDSPYGSVPAYSDLLLHDMGEEGGDGIRFRYGEVGPTELKTQPLWGVAAAGPWMRDGRASTLEEAVQLHGGEATDARDSWLALDSDSQSAILAFLRSLGGGDTLPGNRQQPGVPIPEAGATGGYLAAPATPEAPVPTPSEHDAGRAAFDRLYGPSSGLGAPGFSGDACSACHFEPSIGGSGPLDVNAIRQGRLSLDGSYLPSPQGDFVPKHRLIDPTPFGPDPDAEIIELRQTPHLFGLALIEAIPDAELIQREDPLDTDGDGISGRVARLDDGRIGRLGWKASKADVRDFSCGAYGVELGLTTPSGACVTGLRDDDDGISDPEVDDAAIHAVVDFLRSLAPPERGPIDATVTLGEAVFEQVGCAACHTPELPSPAGMVPLYADLLLHDVAPLGQRSIAEGAAMMREFRTPPLWGLSFSAPYWHTGLADTVADAILLHDGEAFASRTAYEALSTADHDALLAFLGSL